ncbi:DUF2358 domain-containing protein [Anabaena cylindrica FACHB-243]|uniref:DUF2358 domain-containing protein n=1 Tax=Anabaena cylindrica (strain ATCC 27899 / PCC 7122) TaxID=272123 RepID=K9Z8V2_ANACC|nr:MULTISPECIES: DUF2358 domain-containing protein [Anabaena]AFZ55628.1 Protein of unknown function DUF2358 [Anabaena cylindrica PCC 7122]MBD2420432.1 DUF2358 domain-containing protein [Anabaena cylindrica FACHB-243]MBY5281840.1 DUF2358 domain-containing protein [Anabaena sp. CCAP 1446/1C]MBY5310061.1 DUF2358 domain-containing protein [Anabaena sp. CCAP 1446/1C]MCM2406942.1 DUF2358 domain-containing protein [Anabaena sp. CCAP 1446/1C]
MDIIEILKADYQRFPINQTYSIYAPDVYFQDPVFKFRGLELYKWMIKFIQTFFLNLKMDLHNIQRQEDTIKSEWTLSWNSPLPWKPRISISGWSELRLNADSLIISHIDYWHGSRLDVLKQHLFSLNKG